MLARNLVEKESNSINIKKIMLTKIKRLYPAYFLGLLLIIGLHSLKWYDGNVVAWLCSDRGKFKELLLEVLMMQMSGVGDFSLINFPAWYVSVVIIITLIIALFVKYFRGIFIKCLVPFSMIIYLALVELYGNLNINVGLLGIVCIGLIRGFAGMCFGIMIYYIYIKLKHYKINFNKNIIINSLVQFLLLMWFISMLIGNTPSKLDVIILIPISGIILSLFLSQSLISKMLSSKIILFLGKISYSFYICQSFTQIVFKYYLSNINEPLAVFMFIVLNIIIALGIEIFIKKIIS